MVRVEQAIQIIQSIQINVSSEAVPLYKSVGRILSENVHADRNLPPYNRVSMDGIAIASTSFQDQKRFFIESIQAAGTPQLKLTNGEHCIEVMTGAVVPEGTDTVIRYEDVEIENGYAHINLDEVHAGMNIHKSGSDAKQGDILLNSGQRISPAEVSVLASIGISNPIVFKFPQAAIVSTGDELVEVYEQPQAYQIRRSNVYALQSAMWSMGWNTGNFHIADNKDHLQNELERILSDHDVVIITGGVSKGKFDFLPDTLSNLGVEKLFHQVSQRPGKPFWFGVTKSNKVVFALPGNPVSTYLCFFKYIKPWILKLMKHSPIDGYAMLSEDFTFNPSLTYFLQVRIENKNGSLLATPMAGGGSGDFVNLNAVDGFLELPLSKSSFRAGESYPCIMFR